MTRIKRTYALDKSEAQYLVRGEYDGIRLDQFMRYQCSSISRQHIKKKIDKGEIQIDKRSPFPHKPSTKVYRNDIIHMKTYNSKEHEDDHWMGRPIDFEYEPPILFEDEELAVLVKPPFMASHPTGRHLFYCADVYLEAKTEGRVYSVHRLDRETSGILVFAKSQKVSTELIDAFEAKNVRKAYFLIALKEKDVSFPFTASERLADSENPEKRLESRAFPENSKEGKFARTQFVKLAESDQYITALAFPLTGRQHQIRVHAAYHGLPLLGDKIYNGDPETFGRFKEKTASDEDHAKMQIPRHALHSIAINIPYKNSRKHFISQIPQDLKTWLIENTDFNVEEIEEKAKEEVLSYFKKEDLL